MSWLDLQEQSRPHNEVDRISNLPGNIVDIILSGVSLKEAVRTSILSSKWRYRWVTIPSLEFDDESIQLSTQDQTLKNKEVVSIVDRVLLLHTGPIHRFKLFHRHLQGVGDIDRWILHLSRGGSVEEINLLLIFPSDPYYRVPSSIYSCQKLVKFRIFNCILKVPPEFNGFMCLKTLSLWMSYMEQSGFEQLISSCPLLERLTLRYVVGFTLLNIHAPKLLYLDVDGTHAFSDISLQNTFSLTVVRISCNNNPGIGRYPPGSGSVIKFFACVPHIQKLTLCEFTLKYFTFGTIPAELPTPCLDLKYLSISMNFKASKQYLAVLCLLRSSPNLHELQLELHEPQLEANHNDIVQNLESFPLNKLRFIRIFGISGIRQELNLIKTLLENAPLLETMSLRPASASALVASGLDLVKELLLFRRSSPSAQIVYLDPLKLYHY